MAANVEFLSVLAHIAQCLATKMHDERLPDLTPEQVVEWFHSVTVEDLRLALALPEKLGA